MQHSPVRLVRIKLRRVVIESAAWYPNQLQYRVMMRSHQYPYLHIGNAHRWLRFGTACLSRSLAKIHCGQRRPANVVLVLCWPDRIRGEHREVSGRRADGAHGEATTLSTGLTAALHFWRSCRPTCVLQWRLPGRRHYIWLISPWRCGSAQKNPHRKQTRNRTKKAGERKPHSPTSI